MNCTFKFNIVTILLDFELIGEEILWMVSKTSKVEGKNLAIIP